MAHRIILLLFALFVFSSCSKRSGFVYTEMDNKELKDQINLYANYIDSLEPGTEKIITATYKKKNDSTVLFDLSYMRLFESKTSFVKKLSFTFICRVNERDILFFDGATYSRFDNSYHFFKIRPDVKDEIVNRNFLKSDQYVNENNGKQVVDICFDPDHLHLTFVNGKLTQRVVRMGNMFF